MQSTCRPTVNSPSSDCNDLAEARGEFLAILYKPKAYTRDLRMPLLKLTVGLRWKTASDFFGTIPQANPNVNLQIIYSPGERY